MLLTYIVTDQFYTIIFGFNRLSEIVFLLNTNRIIDNQKRVFFVSNFRYSLLVRLRFGKLILVGLLTQRRKRPISELR